MAKKESTKSRIAVVAWKLFHEKGYENTTIDEIILQSGTSKGSFYHYYSGKDELLGALADVFDSWYEEFIQEMDQEMDSYEKLISLCVRVHERIEEEIPVQLLSSLYSAQVVTKGDRHLVNQITRDLPYYEVAKIYTICERAIIYDYCISDGSYSLGAYTRRVMPMLFAGVRAKEPEAAHMVSEEN